MHPTKDIIYQICTICVEHQNYNAPNMHQTLLLLPTEVIVAFRLWCWNIRFSWWMFLGKAKQLQRSFANSESPNDIKHWPLFASHFVEEAGVLWFTISLGAAVQMVIEERCQVPHKNHWPWGVCISSSLKDNLMCFSQPMPCKKYKRSACKKIPMKSLQKKTHWNG